jgi:excisionase family DNA binding protein
MQQLLTEQETSETLRLSRITLHRLRKAGRLGFHRIGSRVMYSPLQVQQFLESTERPGPQQRRHPVRSLSSGAGREIQQ